MSVVPATCLADGKELAVGEVCDIMIGRKSYSGRISATGTTCNYSRSQQTFMHDNHTMIVVCVSFIAFQCQYIK